jgi:hypothetical protein
VGNQQNISVSLESVLEEVKSQRNEFMDQVTYLKAHVRDQDERIRDLEGKLSENSSGE